VEVSESAQKVRRLRRLVLVVSDWKVIRYPAEKIIRGRFREGLRIFGCRRREETYVEVLEGGRYVGRIDDGATLSNKTDSYSNVGRVGWSRRIAGGNF